MAYIVLDSNSQGIFCIAKNSQELNYLCGRDTTYLQQTNKVVEISNEDFISLQTGEKQFSNYTNNTLNLESLSILVPNSKFDYDQIIQLRLQEIEKIKNKHKDSSFLSELNAYESTLKNLDTSSISFPTNITLERYLINQGNSVLGALQLK